MKSTEQFTGCFKELWATSPEKIPLFPVSFSADEKKERESVFTRYTEKYKELEKAQTGNGQAVSSERFFTGFRHFMKKVYNYSDEGLDVILHKSFTDVSRIFVKKARAFDPLLKRDEIFQAMRNVWIMNGLQLLLDKPVGLTPSAFAYSLLYPYSDNFLDDPSVSFEEKLSFSSRFLGRLGGGQTMGKARQEQKISELVAIIENEYPRDSFRGVHDSLMAIHHAQTASIGLSLNGNKTTPDEIQTLVFDKGGTSVLADGYLVSGYPTPEQENFFFGFGVWLQLADDLQDLKEDMAAGTKTMFSATLSGENRAVLSNKTIHFGRSVMDSLNWCSSDVCKRFSEVIVQSLELMLIQSVGLNNSFFPAGYCHHLEAYSPVGFGFLKNMKKKGTPGRMRMLTQLMDAGV